MNGDALARVKERLPGWKPAGKDGTYKACCPAHEDKSPSLSFTKTDKGVVLKCHVGCTTETVVSRMGMTLPQLFDDYGEKKAAKSTRRLFPTPEDAIAAYSHVGEHAGTWAYADAAGNTYAYQVRFNTGPGRKEFRPVAKNCDGWYLGAPERYRLYRVADVMKTAAGELVVVVEGERKADTICDLWLTGTASVNGAKSPAKTDWSPLAGRRVIVIPDNDAAGMSYASAVNTIMAGMDGVAGVVTLEEIATAAGVTFIAEKGDDIVDLVAAAAGDEEILKRISDAISTLAGPAIEQAARHPRPLKGGGGWRLGEFELRLEFRGSKLAVELRKDGRPVFLDAGDYTTERRRGELLKKVEKAGADRDVVAEIVTATMAGGAASIPSVPDAPVAVPISAFEERAIERGKERRPAVHLDDGAAALVLEQILETVGDELYASDNTIVGISKDTDGHLMLRALSPEAMQLFLDKRHAFFRPNDKRDRDVLTDCPVSLARQVVGLRHYPSMRQVDGVAYGPFILADGSIGGMTTGYDAAARVYVDTDRVWEPIPEHPTKDQASESAALLLELVKDFPFVDLTARSAWLAALLTAVGRRAFTGPAPMFLADAAVAGSGKTFTQQAIAIIAEGQRAATMSLGASAEENRKVITSAMAEKATIVLFDNSAGSIGDQALDRLLTSGTYADRKLGTNTTIRRENRLVVLANGNNLAIAGDLVRRCIRWRLEPKVERPEFLEFEGESFEEQVKNRRPELLAAALTVLRYRLQAKDLPNVPAMASFDAWSNLVRTAIVAVGLPDPVATQRDLVEEDETATTGTHLFAAIHAVKGDEWWTTRHLVAEAFADGVGPSYGPADTSDAAETLREAIGDACDAMGPTSKSGNRTTRLGMFLRSRKAVIAGGLRLDRGEKGMYGRQHRVVPAGTPKPGKYSRTL